MTKEKKQIETITVSNTEFLDDDFRPPSSYYIKDALGSYVFVKTRQRKDAQEVINEIYGNDKYKIRTVIKASVR